MRYLLLLLLPLTCFGQFGGFRTDQPFLAALATPGGIGTCGLDDPSGGTDMAHWWRFSTVSIGTSLNDATWYDCIQQNPATSSDLTKGDITNMVSGFQSPLDTGIGVPIVTNSAVHVGTNHTVCVIFKPAEYGGVNPVFIYGHEILSIGTQVGPFRGGLVLSGNTIAWGTSNAPIITRFTTNNWYAVLWTSSSTNFIFYENYALKTNVTRTFPDGEYNYHYMFSEPSVADPFRGIIRDVMIWTNILSSTEIESVFDWFSTQISLGWTTKTPVLPPITSGLVAAYDSAAVSSLNNGASISQWTNIVEATNHWTNTLASSTKPIVDWEYRIGSNTIPTIRFQSDLLNKMQLTNFLGTSYSGLELWLVYQQYKQPTALSNAGSAVCFTHIVDYPPHQPWVDWKYQDSFGRTTRPDIGYSSLSTNGITCYNIASSSANDYYYVWVNSTNMLGVTSGYTFTSQNYEKYSTNGNCYTLGYGDDYRAGSTEYYFDGWIAAVYLYTNVMSASERTNMRTFIHDRFGVSF